ncbi:MAG: hypothetical protein IJD99_01685 [Clostridia bacterium]|nr:hypothetical protein [Clostridia bacterium]
MNEGTTTSLAPDIQRFATSAIQHLSELTAAAYDLREACRFFTEGYSGSSARVPESSVEAPRCDCPAPTAEPRGERGGAQCTMELDAGASDGQPNDKAPSRPVKFPKDNHICRSYKNWDNPPSTEDAAVVLAGLGAMPPVLHYYEAFRNYSTSHNKAILNRTGMRYLAHCLGYVTVTRNMQEVLTRKPFDQEA